MGARVETPAWAQPRPGAGVRAGKRRILAAVRLVRLVSIVGIAGLTFTACGVPQHPDPLNTNYVPTVSAAPSLDRGALSPYGFTQAQRMTVRVRNIGCSGLSTGTGFAIDANTLVTNRHVVENSREIEITTYDGRTVDVTATAITTVADLAIVTTAETIAAVAPVLAQADAVEGDAITVVGYPRGGQLTTVSGVVIGEATDPLGSSLGRVVATTAPVEPGSSGSPALNEAGEVVGVIYAKNDSEQSFMVPVSMLRSLLQQDGLLAPQPHVCESPTPSATPGT